MVVKIHVKVFWVVTPCSVVAGYRRFRGPYCLHLQGGGISETLIYYSNTTRRHNQEDHDVNPHRREKLKISHCSPEF
jgi:hypothetical protein